MPTPRLEDANPTIVMVVCAWCKEGGEPLGAMRPAADERWLRVPHAVVAAIESLKAVSHGCCPTCLARLKGERGESITVPR